MRWLSFQIFNKTAEQQGTRFAIRESQAVELIPFSGVMPTPGAPDAVLGALDFRGRSIRVFDLGAVLGLAGSHLPQRVRVLIVRQSRTAAPMGIAIQPELGEVASLDSPGLQMLDLRLLNRIGRPARN